MTAAKLPGALPVPSLTATIVFDPGNQPGRVAIAGAAEPPRPQTREPRADRRPCHCSACGRRGHSARNPECPARKQAEIDLAERERQILADLEQLERDGIAERVGDKWQLTELGRRDQGGS